MISMLLSQTPPVWDWTPLINLGIAGIMLAWFMIRVEVRLRAIETAVQQYTRAQLVMLIEIKRTSDEAKVQAQQIINDIDASQKAANK